MPRLERSRDPIVTALQARGGLVGRTELAALWGVSRQRVAQLTSDPTFPDPVGIVNGQPAWMVDTCDAWRQARPRAGRPKTVRDRDPD